MLDNDDSWRLLAGISDSELDALGLKAETILQLRNETASFRDDAKKIEKTVGDTAKIVEEQAGRVTEIADIISALGFTVVDGKLCVTYEDTK